jgi:hypothetical protein
MYEPQEVLPNGTLVPIIDLGVHEQIPLFKRSMKGVAE